jgi:uncharacterized protein with NAD-binding domain and iron-sulfur cluster
MAKTKVAILGGGIAGLATAYNLSKSEDLRNEYEVTIYQLGWRLGGKAASARMPDGRNLEHGLHVWFGCYENLFQMLQEIYAARTPPPDSAFQTWIDVVKPQDFTPIGVQMPGGWAYAPVTWPTNSGVPGNGRLGLSPWEIVTEIISLVKILLDHLDAVGIAAKPAQPPQNILARCRHAILVGWHPDSAEHQLGRALTAQGSLSLSELGTAALLWSKALGRDPLRLGPTHPPGIADLFHLASNTLPAKAPATASASTQLALEAVNIFQACLRGVITDLLEPDRPLESLDDVEFRTWLLTHGADPDVVRTSSVVRLIYDVAFQYIDGDPANPSCAAGCALGCCMRLVGTYQGSMMWELQGGMGETLISPLYQALIDAGVKFRFFRKVTSLDLTKDGTAIGKVGLARQVDTNGPDYIPTFTVNGLTCWPPQPDWSQLKDGATLQAKGVNFESHWCDEPPAGSEELAAGVDFDKVVLAISMGAYKKMNNDPSICQALIDHGGSFAEFTQNIGIVPSLSVQLWTNVTTAQLGWTEAKAATVSGPEPLNIWADMSQLLKIEAPAGGPSKSLHYLCGTLPTTLYKNPVSQVNTPDLAATEVKLLTINWLQHLAYAVWPLSCDRQDFKWSVLTDPSNGVGLARLNAQYLQANIDPTECCVGSAVGTTKFRLGPGDFGFSNLVLAGEATRQGFNASSIEGAVMSGIAAAQYITGSNATIVGYDFMTRKPSDFLF